MVELDLFRQCQILEYARTYDSVESFAVFAEDLSNDDLGLTLSLYSKVKFAFWAVICKECMDLIQDFDANVNKYS